VWDDAGRCWRDAHDVGGFGKGDISKVQECKLGRGTLLKSGV
jgi:hypothetical protein